MCIWCICSVYPLFIYVCCEICVCFVNFCLDQIMITMKFYFYAFRFMFFVKYFTSTKSSSFFHILQLIIYYIFYMIFNMIFFTFSNNYYYFRFSVHSLCFLFFSLCSFSMFYAYILFVFVPNSFLCILDATHHFCNEQI